MDVWKDTICDILEELLAPTIIIERNDSSIRKLEGMQEEKGILRGDGETIIKITENENTFLVDLLEGQKTGFFLDQRENRQRLNDYAKGKRVLDCFCYSGAWAIAAAKAGAAEVIGVDTSPKAIELATENANLNKVSDVCKFTQADVFDFLRNSQKKGEEFDLIILDPPAFVKSKRELENALKGYREINSSAMKLLKNNGVLITSSCSYHIDKETCIHVLVKSGEDAHKMVRLLELRTQGRDHPILLPMRETEYLKCAFVEVTHKP
jgi:23S rRNA (cytosine1962-C5)-methyltransferase